MKLQLVEVLKRFGERTVLDHLSLDVDTSQVICLIGASGSGKSTLLRCVNLLEPIDDGTILLDGDDISEPGRDPDPVRRRIGIVFQSFNLFPHMFSWAPSSGSAAVFQSTSPGSVAISPSHRETFRSPAVQSPPLPLPSHGASAWRSSGADVVISLSAKQLRNVEMSSPADARAMSASRLSLTALPTTLFS